MLLCSPFDLRQWEAAVDLRTTWPLADLRFRGSGLSRIEGLTWLFPHQGDEIGLIELAGGPKISSLSASAERIIGTPPERTIATDDELIEGLSFRRRTQGQAAPDDLEETGLFLEVKVQGEPGRLALFPNSPRTYRMTLWESGRGSRGKAPKSDLRVPVAFASPISHRSDGYLASRVGRLLSVGKKHRAIELLQKLDPHIINLEISTPTDFDPGSVLPRGSYPPTLFVEYEGTGLVPIHTMGDGLRRALHLAMVLAAVEPGGVLLIDEIEVGMHTSVLSGVFDWIVETCRDSEIQLFATTHSLEAVDAILAGTEKQDLVLYRIREGKARRLDGDLLHMSRMELGQEVR
jgi:AAA domain, putative AbiEii toxin, Type IV TA system